MKIAELESSIGKNNDVLCSKSNPNWAINNPYLEILAPRFFSGDRVLDWSDLPKRVSKLFLKAERKYSTSDVAEARAQEIGRIIYDGLFFPNSPVMMNSEDETDVNLSAEYLLFFSHHWHISVNNY